MKHAICQLVVGFTAISCMLYCQPARAQQLPTADDYYGRGVHDYFAGCTSCAEQSLSMAISLNPDDPRPYYFRALNWLRLGDEWSARADMELGAELEALRPGQYSVGRALERVQGGHRLLLEKYRRQARHAHAITRDTIRRVRSEQLLERNDRVERRRVSVPLEQLTDDVNADQFPAEVAPRRPQPIAPRPAIVPGAAVPEAGEAAPTDDQADPFLDDPLEPGVVDPSDDADAVPPEQDADRDDAEDPFDVDEEDPFGF